MNWDHVRLFAAVARHGSVGAAARELDVNHSTVLRRLDALEAELGAVLFLRRQQGYRLTPQGEALMAHALQMESEALALQRKARAVEDPLAGRLGVSLPSNSLLDFADLLAGFQREHPDIRLDVDARSNFSDLDRLEAQVSIRLTNEPPPHYVGRRVLDIPYRLYGARDYLDARAPVARPSDVDWIVWSIPLAAEHGRYREAGDTGMESWLRGLDADIRVVTSCNSQELIMAAVLAGQGVATLPQPAAERCPTLQPLPQLGIDYPLGLWLLTHPDIRFQPRVRRFLDYAARYFEDTYPRYRCRTQAVS